MTETGIVIKTEAGRATVRFSRRASCDKCGMCFKRREDMHTDYTLDNGVGAREGDEAVVEVHRALFPAAVLVAYILPLALMAAAFVLSRAAGAPEWAQLIVALFAAAVSFAAASVVDRKFLRGARFKTEIVSVKRRETETGKTNGHRKEKAEVK